ncbi:MAG TPA: flagellar basal body rod protein FlgB [Herminiimonas sp.]|jgi:flagellar basal-body rod protein FlgB|nr:flagellar basal body rod protein FlgB [Herminiimonas sp.]
MLGKLDDMMRFQETALNLREQRQQLLASNIANADTPNFKARDIDFNKALQGALARGGSGSNTTSSTSTAAAGDLTKTTFTHLSSNSTSSATIDGAPLLYANPQQGSIDGNTVDMDVQRNQFTDNAMRYEASLTFISSKIKGMLTAIQGQ